MAFYITWWSLKSIISSSLVFLGFLSFGMLTYLASLNGYFLMHSCFVVCSNYLRLMPKKKRFPYGGFCSSFLLGVMFLSLNLICSYIVMSSCGLVIMLVIF